MLAGRGSHAAPTHGTGLIHRKSSPQRIPVECDLADRSHARAAPGRLIAPLNTFPAASRAFVFTLRAVFVWQTGGSDRQGEGPIIVLLCAILFFFFSFFFDYERNFNIKGTYLPWHDSQCLWRRLTLAANLIPHQFDIPFNSSGSSIIHMYAACAAMHS